MEKSNSTKTFSYYLNDINNSAEFLKTFPDNSVSNMATNISSNVKELKTALVGIKLTLILLSAITLTSLLVAGITLTNSKFRGYFYDDNTVVKDSLLNLDDKNTTIEYQTKRGKMITYNDLVKENDTLLKKYLQFQTEIKLFKSELELCNFELKDAQNNLRLYKKNSNEYEGMVRDRQIDDIKNLVNNSKKIDSGKILLETFRKSMKYDPKTKSWNIDLRNK